MDTERIEDEILSIASIYEDSFERDIPTVWQKHNVPPAFHITVVPDDPDLHTLVSVRLHVTYTNTYPKNPATFVARQPQGLSPAQVQALNKLMRDEALRCAGEEMVLTIAMFASSWMSSNNNIPKGARKRPDKTISLAAEMIQRTKDREEEHRLRAEQAKNAEEAKMAHLVDRIDQAVQEKKETMSRRESERKTNESQTIIDSSSASDVSIEVFEQGVDFGDGPPVFTFQLSCPRQDGLATVYYAQPVGDIHPTVAPLELHRVEFDTHYYTHGQGQSKIAALDDEFRRLISLRHENLLSIFASKLTTRPGGVPVLCFLAERVPSLSLPDLLHNCDTLPFSRCRVFLAQALKALQYMHAKNLTHRAVTPASIWISTATEPGSASILKLGRFWYHSRLLDLCKSNRFGPVRPDHGNLPDSWLPQEVIQSRYQYTRRRDIWYLGVVVLQMLGGLNIITDFPQPSDAIAGLAMPLEMQSLLLSVFEDNKKRTPSCPDLLQRLHEWDEAPEVTLSMPMVRNHTSGARSPTATVHAGSPQIKFTLKLPSLTTPSSRYHQDWEELEFLGKGGFGSVVKARLKHDNRIYAIKKVRLRRENDAKILREVNALSRMSHSSIVRYYTTWVETVPSRSQGSVGTETGSSSDIFDDDSGGSGSDESDPFHVSEPSLPEISFARSTTFPSLQRNSAPASENGDHGDDSGSSQETQAQLSPKAPGRREGFSVPSDSPLEILYIQMEYVEKQTLREAIDEGLSEERIWVLLRQILDALEHIASWGIVHRDIKPGNIFIDAKGDVKVGDFGLASWRTLPVDMPDIEEAMGSTSEFSELTTGVGTSLYIAPEVIDRKPGQNHSKADMYSLGIVFFEMNMPAFHTNTERFHVITALRSPKINFPLSWSMERANQQEVIRLLLRHNPGLRPSAAELSRNELLPKRMEEESINEALRLLVNPQSRRYDALLKTLFTQPIDPAKVFSYEATNAPREYAPLIPVVRDHVVHVFRLHGAIEDDPPLLMPLTESQETEKNAAPVFLDRQGDLVMLPKSVVVPLARSAALSGLVRIKRYFCGRAFQDAPGQPTAWQQAAFDIISKDTESLASEAEAISVMDEILRAMPGVETQTYDLYISHSALVEAIFHRIPLSRHREVIMVLDQQKTTVPQKRVLLANLGLNRSIIDEIEGMLDEVSIDDAPNRYGSRPESNPNASEALEQIRQIVVLASAMGVRRRVRVKPFLMACHPLFGPGIIFEFRGTKRVVVGRGGRYDHLISQFTPPSKSKRFAIKAIGVQVVLEQIAHSLNAHQKATLQGLIKERRSYGAFSPRRCDVYVISMMPTTQVDAPLGPLLERRVRLASNLWRCGISADLMYDEDIDNNVPSHLTRCCAEGILFLLWETRYGTYKVKSVLKGSETEGDWHEIILYLAREIAEQKRLDQAVSGTALVGGGGVEVGLDPGPVGGGGSSQIQVILSGDAAKKKHKAKIAIHGKAFAAEQELKRELAGGAPVIAVDAPAATLAALTVDTSWVSSGEAWRGLVSEHGALQGMGNGLRDTVQALQRRKSGYALLFSVRDDKMFLLRL